MTRKELGILVFKIAGLYLFLQGFILISQILGQYFLYLLQYPGSYRIGSAQGVLIATQLIPQLLMFAGGWFLIAKSELLALGLFGGINSEAVVSRIELPDVLTAAYSVAGVYLCADGIPKICTGVWSYWLYAPSAANRGSIGYTSNLLMTGVLQLVLGVCLFLGSRGLVNFRRKFRQM